MSNLHDEPARSREHDGARHGALRARGQLGHRRGGRVLRHHHLRHRLVGPHARTQGYERDHERRQEHEVAPKREQGRAHRHEQGVHHIAGRDHRHRPAGTIAGEHLHPAQDDERPAHAAGERRHEGHDAERLGAGGQRHARRERAATAYEQGQRAVEPSEVREDRHAEVRDAACRDARDGVGLGRIRSRAQVEQPRALQQPEPHDSHRHEQPRPSRRIHLNARTPFPRPQFPARSIPRPVAPAPGGAAEYAAESQGKGRFAPICKTAYRSNTTSPMLETS